MNDIKPPVKINVREMKEIMDHKHYTGTDDSISTSLDILAVYIKGQTILYTEAKVYCEQQLNMLMLPAIFISSLCTVVSIALQNFIVGSYIVSGLAAFNSFILALISYLKLDAKSEAHKTSAYQYGKLRTLCEFTSGKVMFFDTEEPGSTNKDENKRKQVIELVEEIQKKLEEIKDTNKFILPQHIRYSFNILSSENIFSNIKSLQLEELQMLSELKNIHNEINELEYQLNMRKNGKVETNEKDLADRQEYIYSRTGALENQTQIILSHRQKYLNLESKFKNEIQLYMDNNKGCCSNCFSWLKT